MVLSGGGDAALAKLRLLMKTEARLTVFAEAPAPEIESWAGAGRLSLVRRRMGPGDAIYAGFADYYIPEGWDVLKAGLCETGDVTAVDLAAASPPDAPLAAAQSEIDALFAGETLADIARTLETSDTPLAKEGRKELSRNAPLSMAACVEILHRLGDDPTFEQAVGLEYRFTARASEQGDFIEGIRAQIIDKDRRPKWAHTGPTHVPLADLSDMLRPFQLNLEAPQ